MKIRLRVAGIYFNRHLLVPPNVDGSPITIKNAMDYCASEYRIEKVNGFAYKDESMPRPDGKRFQVVHSISHFFPVLTISMATERLQRPRTTRVRR